MESSPRPMPSTVADNLGIGVAADKNISIAESEVRGNDSLGVWSSEGRVHAHDCNVSDNGAEGIAAETRARVSNCTVSRNGTSGINVPGLGIVVRNSIVSDNGWFGVIHAFFGRVKIKDSVVSGNGHRDLVTERSGVYGEIVTIRGSDISGNRGRGVFADRSRIVDSTLIGNGTAGAWATPGPLRVQRSEVRDNDRFGLWVDTDCRMYVADSTVTGNGTKIACGVSEACADLASCREPVHAGTTVCGTSYDADSGFPGTHWGACSLD